MIHLKCFKEKESAVIPSKAHEGDAGYDLTVIEQIQIYSKTISAYTTGIRIAPDKGYHTEIVASSSLFKKGYMIVNNIGIIDNIYRGPLIIVLEKIDPNAKDLELPAKIAQLIPRKTITFAITEVAELSETDRGEGGFGSTDNPSKFKPQKDKSNMVVKSNLVKYNVIEVVRTKDCFFSSKGACHPLQTMGQIFGDKIYVCHNHRNMSQSQFSKLNKALNQ